MALNPSLVAALNPATVRDYQIDDAKNALAQQLGTAQIQNQQITAQAAQDEMANKRRAMAVSMLNGIANEKDPEKQAALYATLKPMAERYDTTLKLPDQYDSGLANALVSSQIPAKDQLAQNVELQKALITAAARDDKAPSGYRFAADGTLAAIPGGPGDQANKPVNEFQGKSGVFAARMQDAEDQLEQFANAGTSPKQRALAEVPLVGNFLVSDDYQQLDQAKRNFINSVLRQESGAAINKSEFDNAERQYFPQPGDTPATIAQKEQNRKTALAQMGRSAGPAFTPKEPAKPQAPKVGVVEDGYVYLGGDPSSPSSWKRAK